MKTEPQHPEHRHQNHTTLVTFLAILILALGITFQMVLPYLLALIMGGILALLSTGSYKKLKQRLHKPKLAAALTTLGLALLVIVPLAMFLNLAIKQGIALGHEVAENDLLSPHSILDRIGNWRPVQMFIDSPEALEKQARGWVQGAGKGVSAEVLSIAANVPKILLQITLALIACFFFLLDGQRFMAWMADKIPLDHDVRKKIIESFESTAVSVIWATFAAAAAQSL
ncbi:MAG: AI-2E family transporter, partial [Bdellovibrionia bacterium]